MTEQERRALFFKVTGQVYACSPMSDYRAFCKGLEAGYEAGRKDENEACAKVCEDLMASHETSYDLGWSEGLGSAADAIRARREQ